MTQVQRRLYRLLVHLHPAEFRHEFGRDMLLDFEDAAAHTQFAPLYLDALLSLARRWAESAVSGGAVREPATKTSLLTGQYIVFGDESLSPLEFCRRLIAALVLIALLAAAQRSSPAHLAAIATPPEPTPPSFPQAMGDQAGLKLVPDKSQVVVYLLDHIERPTAN